MILRDRVYTGIVNMRNSTFRPYSRRAGKKMTFSVLRHTFRKHFACFYAQARTFGSREENFHWYLKPSQSLNFCAPQIYLHPIKDFWRDNSTKSHYLADKALQKFIMFSCSAVRGGACTYRSDSGSLGAKDGFCDVLLGSKFVCGHDKSKPLLANLHSKCLVDFGPVLQRSSTGQVLRTLSEPFLHLFELQKFITDIGNF